MTASNESGERRRAEQARDLPIDAHMHTDLSPDSMVPLELYAAQAAERGIPEIAITDHVDFMPGAPAYKYADYGKREMIVREAAERWAGRVTIRFGVELTYESRYEEEIREHLRTHSYDYAIGSVHAQSDGPYDWDRIESFVAGKTVVEATEFYFGEVLATVRSGLFDTMGHLDMCKRWLQRWFPPSAFAAAPEMYEPILAALAESDMALEVNSSGLRQGIGETYPPAWAVARYRELGGRQVTVGSDAHLPESFAFGLEEAYAIVAAAGFSRLSLKRAMERGDLVLPERFR